MTWSQTLAALTLFAAACHPSADEGAHGAADTDTVVELRPDGRDLLELQAATTEPLGGRVDHGMPVTLTMDVLLVGASTDPLNATLDFLDGKRALYRLSDPKVELYPGRVDATADTHVVVLRQQKGGVPVLDAELHLVLGGDHLRLTHGHWLPEIADLSVPTTPLVGPLQAVNGVKTASEHLRGVPALRIADARVVAGVPAGAHLVWLALLESELDAREVLIDALDGTLLLARPALRAEAPDHRHQVRWNNGAPSAGVGTGTLWFDQDGSKPAYAPVDDPDAEGQLAHDTLRDLRDFMWDRFGRNGHRADGAAMEAHVDLDMRDKKGNPAPNAFYTWGSNSMSFHDGLLTVDVLAHEYGHAWEDAMLRLDYSNESGALSESVADVFALVFERAQGGTDWVIGEGTILGAMRDLADPPHYGQPDHVLAAMSGSGRGEEHEVVIPDTWTNDSGWVHYNSGIPNKAAWLMATGGTHGGLVVRPIGDRAALLLVYLNVGAVLTPGASFEDMADGMAGLAHLMGTGFSSAYPWQPEGAGTPCDVENAYAAVGMWIGPVDADCDGTPDGADLDDDDDFVPDAVDLCRGVPDPSQEDLDADGIGDACDPDADGDGVRDLVDPCVASALPATPAYDTADNHPAWACHDRDGDGLSNPGDVCPRVANPDQADADHDGKGDACDDDDDNDQLLDASDNCPKVQNPGQENSDADAVGDACDNCLLVDNADQRDCDGDGVGRACEGTMRWCDGPGCDRSADVCPEDFGDGKPLVLDKDSLIPIPPMCAGCPEQLGLAWMDAVSFPITVLDVPFGVRVVGPRGEILDRTELHEDGQLDLHFGPAFSYRAPGATDWASYEGWGLQLDPSLDLSRVMLEVELR